MKYLNIIFIILISSIVETGYAQTYYISDGGTHITCSGSFYDSGGPGGDYGNNENYTITFCSADTGVAAIVVVNFASAIFKAQDHLYIYDGSTTSDPLLIDMTNGSYSGYISSSGSCLTFQFISNGNQTNPGWDATVSCFICGDVICNEAYEDCSTCPNDCNTCPDPTGGPYIHPTSGVGGSYTGTCMVNTCTGSYYDDGGSAGTYSLNVNDIYRTFCPDQAGKCIQMSINYLDLEYTLGPPAGCYDYLWVLDGPTQNSTTLWEGCGSTYVPQILTIAGTYASTFTSSDSSGCLSVRFHSDGLVAWDGWDISISCVNCSQGPTGTDGNDCSNATVVCSDGSFSDNGTGPGLSSDACEGCVTSENYTNWYYFEASVSGTIELSIVPNAPSDDYDFALFEASSCSSLGSPVRCSYSGLTGNTGMANGSGDISEGASGDSWVNGIYATAGQGFFLMVNRWSPASIGSGFTLNWSFPDGASLDCSVVVPIELSEFSSECLDGNQVRLGWTTLSEINNNYFEIQKSLDAKDFYKIGKLNGAGNSNLAKKYFFIDHSYKEKAYYRIKQVDFDGKHSYSNIIFQDCNDFGSNVNIYPNPAKEGSDIQITGIRQDDKITISDVSGQQVYYKHFSDLKKGVYFVKIGPIITKKLIIY